MANRKAKNVPAKSAAEVQEKRMPAAPAPNSREPYITDEDVADTLNVISLIAGMTARALRRRHENHR